MKLFYFLSILFIISLVGINNSYSQETDSDLFKSESKLATGTWFKIGITKDGVYSINYSTLTSLGVNPLTLNTNKIGVFSGNIQMLPESNSNLRVDDLEEIKIKAIGLEDGTFNEGDMILFYANSTNTWNYDTVNRMWLHTKNLYSDTSYYFFTTDRGSLLSIDETNLPTINNITINEYEYRAFVEDENFNLGKSGKRWFGDMFDMVDTRNYPFNIPNRILGKPVKMKVLLAAKSLTPSNFTLKVGNNVKQVNIMGIGGGYGTFLARQNTLFWDISNTDNNINLEMKYNKPDIDAIGYLDYININATCKLQYFGTLLDFRNYSAINRNTVAKYVLSGTNDNVVVWDITNPFACSEVKCHHKNNSIEFYNSVDTLHEYIAFEYVKAETPTNIKRIDNQNLHGISPANYLIITPQIFYEQAVRLASFHGNYSNLSANVVLLDKIYNEFSGGKQDVAAIRDFVRMLYLRGNKYTRPKYLLLMGDASYDYKNRISPNTNFVPTHQTTESLDPLNSIASDDFFGYMDENEGNAVNDIVDIGIGRLPVKNTVEAENVVNKIINYHLPDSNTMKNWRTKITFVADDEEDNALINDSEYIVNAIDAINKNVNINKIYLDAYVQESNSSGSRYPEVNKAIARDVEKGCLFINYLGHGGYTGWAHEEVLTMDDINNFENTFNLPIFVTGTCSFAPYDDPAIVSAGELLINKANGGSVALFTTARATFGPPNLAFITKLFQKAFDPDSAHFFRLGDYIKHAKQEEFYSENSKKIVLLGDPATKAALPYHKVLTLSINNKDTTNTDTLKAFDEVKIKGGIFDHNNRLIDDYNGVITTTVYDKPTTTRTLGNDSGATTSFQISNNIIYRGKAMVTNGLFEVVFQMPKDINYTIDYGKISYYATNFVDDAWGNFAPLIGGESDFYITDNTGPNISLFMNDLRFVDGGLTDPNPWFIAVLEDESGINTVGTGIGHEITAILDDNYTNPYILNDFYESDVNTYKKGVVKFPFIDLAPGEHHIDFKVWDIFNNSSSARINFTVTEKNIFQVNRGFAYPNPFTDKTNIIFEHNQKNVTFEIVINIFSMSGVLVRTIKSTDFQFGSISKAIEWDGRSDNGRDVPAGFYLFNISIKTSEGLANTTHGKIIKIK
ncbi:MAG: type IX secretion system sortase PorU [Lentimicrobiaceae bacterium]|nr:type IX secretion system sortase PorU [Lentimicrobiaceae bacterium]